MTFIKNKYLLLLLISLFSLSPVIAMKEDDLINSEIHLHVIPRHDWTNLFKRSSGWIAADGIFTVSMDGNDELGSATPNTKTLFTFQDTFLGHVNEKNDKIEDKTMVCQSMAILTGNSPDPKKIDFIWGCRGNKASNEQSDKHILEESSKDNPFWINDGVCIGNKIHCLVMDVRGRDAKGVRMLTIPVNGNIPNISRYKMTPNLQNLFHSSNGHRVVMGVGILNNKNDNIYVYGYRFQSKGSHPKKLVVARTNRDSFSNVDNWEFCVKDNKDYKWVKGIENANNDEAELHSNISCELSVTHITTGLYNDQYMLVYTKNVVSDTLEYALAPTPYGPFNKGVPFYCCPEHEGSKKGQKYTYNAKAHPHLSSPGKLLVSYNVNLKDVEITDNNTYRPQFVEIDLYFLTNTYYRIRNKYESTKYMYDDQGRVIILDKPETNDKKSHWLVEGVGNGYYKLKNRETGRYMSIHNNQGWVESMELEDQGWWDAQWKFINTDNEYHKIQNHFRPEKHMNIHTVTHGYVQNTTLEDPGWHDAQWHFEAVTQ